MNTLNPALVVHRPLAGCFQLDLEKDANNWTSTSFHILNNNITRYRDDTILLSNQIKIKFILLLNSLIFIPILLKK